MAIIVTMQLHRGHPIQQHDFRFSTHLLDLQTWIVAVVQIAPTAPIMMETPRLAAVMIPGTVIVARTATAAIAAVVTSRLLLVLKYRIMRFDRYCASGWSTISGTHD